MCLGGENIDAARDQARSEHNQGQAASNTHNWDAGARDAYEAERSRLQRDEEQRRQQSW